MMKLPFIVLISLISMPASAVDHTRTAIFAGGCFWCMEPPFDKLDGVISTTSGYTAGHTQNPTYREVSAGGTGHAEAIKIRFDPEKISYSALLDVFWKNIDPVAADR
ncbi:MAG TPA: peptide-methionine (S)-S-oxide reductase, partial [Gammaproteobacteria bacterium]|nr:peptide-methionine (S)-S-oxide reductase [Gammaproteobacteria bacterium]